MIPSIGLLVILYAAYYLGAQDPPGRFYALIMLFMAAMLGVVLSDNLLLLVVFWELTSVSSFLLVGYWGHRAEARAGRAHGAGRHRRGRAGAAGRHRAAGRRLPAPTTCRRSMSRGPSESARTRATRWRWC